MFYWISCQTMTLLNKPIMLVHAAPMLATRQLYSVTAHRLVIVLVIVSCLIGTVYPGKDKISRRATIAHQRITSRKQSYLYPPKRETIYKKNIQTSLYQAVCDKDISAVKLILSSSKQIDTNKKYLPWGNTALHIAVVKQSPTLAALLLKHPKTDSLTKNKLGISALDLAIALGSHTMVKTFTRASNFDPTKRDKAGESTINKLEKRNAWWAENLCRYLLRNSLQPTSHEPMQCMICFDTPAEILQAAANNPIDAHKKPEQLMSITRCCHALLCTQDKTEWLKRSSHRNCPACRKPL